MKIMYYTIEYYKYPKVNIYKVTKENCIAFPCHFERAKPSLSFQSKRSESRNLFLSEHPFYNACFYWKSVLYLRL